MRMIRVMCSGRIDLSFVLKAFAQGVDGVFIGGCHLNECNYITHGNYHALTMVSLAKRILSHLSLSPDRIRIQLMSGAEATLFAESVTDFVSTIKKLGPLATGEGLDPPSVTSRLQDLLKLVPYLKIQTQEKLSSRPSDYESLFSQSEVDELLLHPTSYYIDPEKCQACTTCFRRCPAEAIISARGEIHIVDQQKCIKCGTCYDVCPPKFRAVTKIVNDPVPPPLPEGQRAVVRKKDVA
jgi:F420-non-reducing hydrogenase iron-sulfur subunit